VTGILLDDDSGGTDETPFDKDIGLNMELQGNLKSSKQMWASIM
jgi:hypothetical protein